MKRLTFIILLLTSLRLGAQDLAQSAFAEVTSLSSGEGRVLAGLVMGESRHQAVAAVSAVSADGRQWAAPVVLPFEAPVASAVVWAGPEGKDYAFASRVLPGGDAELLFSVGGGSVWSTPERIGSGFCSSVPVLTDKGDWLLPASDGKGNALIFRSVDQGRSWTRIASVTPPSKIPLDVQPALVAGEGRLDLYLRSAGFGWSYRSVSRDGGQHWSEPVYNIPVPDQRFAEIRLSDGRLLSVKNGRLGQHLYKLSDGLYAFLSDDNGETWYGSMVLEAGVEASGPVATELPGGGILIAYNYAKAEKQEIRAVVTSVGEIDAATANTSYKAFASVRFPALVPGKAVEAFQTRYAQKKKFAKKPLTIGSYNIQYQTSNWESERIPVLKAFFEEYHFDVFGTQEPYRDQVVDLLGILGEDYDWVGGVPGEYDRPTLLNPVFYRKSRLEVLQWDNLWFTEVPDTPGYGAFTPRMCVWVKFRDKASGEEFFLFNSHFDHRGHEARKVSAILLLEKVRELAGGLPVFLTGDFNDVEGSFSYDAITSSGFLSDTMTSVEKPVNAEFNSEPGYRAPSTFPRKGLHIDHIFYTPSCVKLLSWELLTYTYNGKMGSDHIPIMIQCKLATK